MASNYCQIIDYMGNPCLNKAVKSDIPNYRKLCICKLHQDNLFVAENKRLILFLNKIYKNKKDVDYLYLEKLDLKIIKKIPRDITKLYYLKTLIIQGSIFKIPKEICRLSNLKKIIMTANNLQQIPKELGILKNVEYMDFSYNTINSIPNELFRKDSKLKYINLSYNYIKYIPKNIFEYCHNLTSLIIFNNNVSYIPQEIGKLKKLKNIILSNNYIQDIPKTIVDLKKTRKLYLGSNRIKFIDDIIITKLKLILSLEELDLSLNSLDEETIKKLEDLKISFLML